VDIYDQTMQATETADLEEMMRHCRRLVVAEFKRHTWAGSIKESDVEVITVRKVDLSWEVLLQTKFAHTDRIYKVTFDLRNETVHLAVFRLSIARFIDSN
jgi:hypothetical protein